MYRPRLFVLASLTLCFAQGIALRAQTGQALPDGKGKAQFVQICSHCHGLEMATAHRNTAEGWSAVVDDMVSRGAQGKDDDFQLVVAYLTAQFGSQADESKASTAGGPTTPGKEVYAANGCANCHLVGETGSRMGPDACHIGDRRTPDRLEHSIVEPDEEVLQENRMVVVTLQDGTEVKGRILNHDAVSVQLIDSKEKLRSFEGAKIRGYKILTKGLMPSYQGKLSGKQIADLVAYLSSLKAAQ